MATKKTEVLKIKERKAPDGVDPQVHMEELRRKVLVKTLLRGQDATAVVVSRLVDLGKDDLSLAIDSVLMPERLVDGSIIFTVVARSSERGFGPDAKRFACFFGPEFGIPKASIENWQGPIPLTAEGKLVSVRGQKAEAFACRFRVRRSI